MGTWKGLLPGRIAGSTKVSEISIFFMAMVFLLLSNSMVSAAPITLKSSISLSNISVTNLDALNITAKVVDAGSTSASAVASDIFVDSQTQSQRTSLGSVSDTTQGGKARSSSSLLYNQQANNIFMGNNYTLNSEVSLKKYGYAQALATVSEMIYFTALTSCDVIFSLDYSGTDDNLNPGLDPHNYSYAGICYQIANFNDSISLGFAGNVLDAYLMSPGTLSSSLHFDQGDSGWITLGASAGTSLYAPAPVPEPSTMLLVAAGLIGLARFRKQQKL
ncbi:MAG TPA: PEP-CTERM sorting domain-containing protein [Deltaproteobacteria bacterium]|nr:PEP-CTERM sorting domain-containing protein [Deltaproteobacteria bacterium]